MSRPGSHGKGRLRAIALIIKREIVLRQWPLRQHRHRPHPHPLRRDELQALQLVDRHFFAASLSGFSFIVAPFALLLKYCFAIRRRGGHEEHPEKRRSRFSYESIV